MPKIIPWTEDYAQKELKKRLEWAMTSRDDQERIWENNERIVYGIPGQGSMTYGFDDINLPNIDAGPGGLDNGDQDGGASYVFKNLRFIHAQISANPPTVVPRATSTDSDDRRRADAADRLVRFALRKYDMQDVKDRASLNTLLYGTGVVKTIWDGSDGDILGIKENGDLDMEGAISISVPSIWDIFPDPDARCVKDIRYLFQRIFIPWEDALYFFGEEKEQILQSHRRERRYNRNVMNSRGGGESRLDEEYYDVVEVFEFWETGLPCNGYGGRHCYCTLDGTQLTPVDLSPFAFRSPRAKDNAPKMARLPYHFFTDIDVPNRIWGKSFVEYVANSQDNLTRLDGVTLDNIQSSGYARLIIPSEADVEGDIDDTSFKVHKVSGGQAPYYMNPPSPPAMNDNYRTQLKLDIDELSGINESMMGKQSRETSGFAMQYATNQGNMIRRRLFNKYVMFVESIYKGYLDLVREYWTTPQTVTVLGKEKALEAVDIMGADINGGFDLVVEYGASLSLDPMTRRDEIMSLMPAFEKAGIPPNLLIKQLKLAELDTLYDIIAMADERQREYFEEIIFTNGERDVRPQKYEDHVNMLAYCFRYVMTAEFKYLGEQVKQRIRQHIDARVALQKQEQAPLEAPAAPDSAPGGGGETAPPELAELLSPLAMIEG